jgi:hypothetical protein
VAGDRAGCCVVLAAVAVESEKDMEILWLPLCLLIGFALLWLLARVLVLLDWLSIPRRERDELALRDQHAKRTQTRAQALRARRGESD